MRRRLQAAWRLLKADAYYSITFKTGGDAKRGTAHLNIDQARLIVEDCVALINEAKEQMAAVRKTEEIINNQE